MPRIPRQLSLPIPAGWGGRRVPAGRKPKGERAGVTHNRRPLLARRFPVHVTLRVLPHVWNLRSKRSFAVIREALGNGGDRFGMRICEFSVQGNHLHLVAEAQDARALSHGMQGFGVRLARGLNRLMHHAGKVLADRFHSRILRTPTEVARVVRYVRANRAIHRERWIAMGTRGRMPLPPRALAASPASPQASPPDPYSSAAPDHGICLPSARTFLLSRAQAQAPAQAQTTPRPRA